MRLTARTRRLERMARGLPDPDAFDRGLGKMLRPFSVLADPACDRSKVHRFPPMEPLTRAERVALEAEGIDGLVGLLGWAMRQPPSVAP